MIATEGIKSEQTCFMGRFLGPQLGRAHGWAGQGCGELETSPAAASLGQGLMAPGADVGSWAVGSPGGPGRDSQGWWCSEDAGAGEYLLVLQAQLYC